MPIVWTKIEPLSLKLKCLEGSENWCCWSGGGYVDDVSALSTDPNDLIFIYNSLRIFMALCWIGLINVKLWVWVDVEVNPMGRWHGSKLFILWRFMESISVPLYLVLLSCLGRNVWLERLNFQFRRMSLACSIFKQGVMPY